MQERPAKAHPTFKTMPVPISQRELESYLDEALPVEEMTRIEKAFRHDPALARQLAEILARRDSGVISLGEVWRRHRLSCPSRQELGSFLLGVLPDDVAQYLTFHLESRRLPLLPSERGRFEKPAGGEPDQRG